MTGPDRCTRCHRAAVAHQPYSGRALCTEHLVRDVESRAKRAFRQQAGLRHGERVGLAADGGPHGDALLAFAARQFGARRDITLLALVPSPEAYAPAGVEVTATGGGDPVAAARRLGCTLLLVPTTLEERAAEVLGAVLSGQTASLIAPAAARPVRVARPFEHVPGAEILLYLEAVAGAARKAPAPPEDPFGAFVAGELARHARSHPSAPFALVRLADALSALGSEEGRC